METQNVTLAIPKHILRKAKLIAVRQNTSLSGLLTHALEEIVTHEEGYEQAHKRHQAILASGLDLGTGGKISWNRDELHER